MSKSVLSNNQYQQIVSVNSTQGQWNSYTPDFQGLGTVTNVNIKWRQNGPNLEVEGYFSISGGTGVEARMSFPNIGIISSLSLPALSLAGQAIWNDAANPAQYLHGLREPGVSYFTFGGKQTTQSQLFKINGNDYMSVAHNISVKFSVPIEGWQSAQTHIMNIADPYENIYSARITNNGAASILSQSTDFISSVTRTGPGVISVVFKPGLFTQAPSVATSGIDDNRTVSSVTSLTTSGCTISTLNEASPGTFTDRGVSILVQRQGVDYKEPKGYFISNGTLTRWQKKILTAQVSVNGTVAALGFNNLEVGKTYRLTAQTHHLCGANVTSTLSYTNGSNIVLFSQMDPESAASARRTAGGSSIFTATAVTVVATATVAGGAVIEPTDTWVILEEVPWHQQTLQWT